MESNLDSWSAYDSSQSAYRGRYVGASRDRGFSGRIPRRIHPRDATQDVRLEENYRGVSNGQAHRTPLLNDVVDGNSLERSSEIGSIENARSRNDSRTSYGRSRNLGNLQGSSSQTGARGDFVSTGIRGDRFVERTTCPESRETFGRERNSGRDEDRFVQEPAERESWSRNTFHASGRAPSETGHGTDFSNRSMESRNSSFHRPRGGGNGSKWGGDDRGVPSSVLGRGDDNDLRAKNSEGGSSRGGDFGQRRGRLYNSNQGGNNHTAGHWGTRELANSQTFDMPCEVKAVENEKKPPLKGARSVPQLVQELEEKLSKGSVECMICYDKVGRAAPVWSCDSCFSIFHLTCIRKWARAPTSSDLSVTAGNRVLGDNWRCPGCQFVQLTSASDLRYRCFCGQLEEPPMDYYLTPHSCGNPCQKSLNKGKMRLCSHHCTMQCHPGPCPPCAAMAPAQSCPCGKTCSTRRCSEQEKGVSSCGQICDRKLNCGRHFCQKICHEDQCGACAEKVKATCHCGRQEENMFCGQVDHIGDTPSEIGLFSCDLVCMKLLECQNHQCKEQCHAGPCGKCDLLPSEVQTCPCGKQMQHELADDCKIRKSCLDPIPTCGQVCEKALACTLHNCQHPCHSGQCPPCMEDVKQKCRCGSSMRTVPCFETLEELDGKEYLCERKCGKKKNCGRHRCNDRCCPTASDSGHDSRNSLAQRDLHLCLIPCGKKLQCRQHYCKELCHAGHCPPCLEFIFTELSCACGKTSTPPPMPCGTPPPSCTLPCSKPQPCGHKATHLCHFGDCPPCTVPIAKECVGNHVVLRGVPCGSKDIKCNNLCGKTRQCGLHACSRTCHVSPCDAAVECGSNIPNPRASCGQLCGAPRRDCQHSCVAQCHPLSPCPEVQCKAMVTITCGCGRLMVSVPCGAGGRVDSSDRKEFEAFSLLISKLPARLQQVDAKGRIPLGQRKLACDEECAKLEKKRVLSEAFYGAGGALTISEGGIAGGELVEVIRKDLQWVVAVEDRFKYLLVGKRSGTMRVHIFCSLSKEKEAAMYQLTDRWGLLANRVGAGSHSLVIVQVTSKSKVPARLLGSKGGLSSAGQLPVAPSFNPALDLDPRLVVALFDLPRDVDVSTLMLRFGGECELVWVNDRNAFAIFGDGMKALVAVKQVDFATTYEGAVSSTQSTRHGPRTHGQPSLKVASRKKEAQEATWWDDDAWGEDRGSDKEQAGGPWARKGPPISTSQNPWGALIMSNQAATTEAAVKTNIEQLNLHSMEDTRTDVSQRSRAITNASTPGPSATPAEEDDWEKLAT